MEQALLRALRVMSSATFSILVFMFVLRFEWECLWLNLCPSC